MSKAGRGVVSQLRAEDNEVLSAKEALLKVQHGEALAKSELDHASEVLANAREAANGARPPALVVAERDHKIALDRFDHAAKAAALAGQEVQDMGGTPAVLADLVPEFDNPALTDFTAVDLAVLRLSEAQRERG
jgi:hypothetical protein